MDNEDKNWDKNIWLMEKALEQARVALEFDEVPIGAVIERDGEIIAAAHNRRIIDTDPSGHAEMVAIRAAARAIGDWRLEGCSLAVTLEPCCMCAGAIVLARIPTLIYAAADPKGGAVDTLYNLCNDPRLNHSVEVHAGILADESAQLLRDFFKQQREMGKK